MEPTGVFSYADYCRQQEQVATTVGAAPSHAPSEVAEDNDHIYRYVAMREPDPARDAQPVAYTYYPQQYAYAYPPQACSQAPQDYDYMRTYVSARSPKSAASTVCKSPKTTYTKSPKMAYAQPAGYAPIAYAQPAAYTAVPYAYAMPDYPVPVHSKPYSSGKSHVTKKKCNDEEKPADKPSKTWVGRTKKQVDEDNIKIAINEGIYEPNEIVPKGAKPDQLFWVVENDGTNTLRTFTAIEGGALGKGSWKIDPRYGNAYFVLAKEEKKEKEKK